MIKSKRKVLWLAHEGNLSGANIALLEYADALKDIYHFYFILPHAGGLSDELKKKSYPFKIIPQYAWTVPLKSTPRRTLKMRLRNVCAIGQTLITIKLENIDCVFTNSQSLYTAASAARMAAKPHVWWLHEFGEEDFGFRIGYGYPEKALALMATSRLIIANSEAVKEKFRRLLPGITVERVYQPVTVEPISSVRKTGCYLMFGQLSPAKGHKEIIDVFKSRNRRNPADKLCLHIIGPAENENYLNELRALSADASDTGIKILPGYFKKHEIIPAYKQLIVGSQSEAFGRVITEAHKYGVRTIVRNSGGAPEQINESNGRLFESKEDLINIIEQKDTSFNEPIRSNYEEGIELENLKRMLSFV